MIKFIFHLSDQIAVKRIHSSTKVDPYFTLEYRECIRTFITVNLNVMPFNSLEPYDVCVQINKSYFIFHISYRSYKMILGSVWLNALGSLII